MSDIVCTCSTDTSAVDLGELTPLLERYGSDAASLIPILQETQSVFGHLPRAALIEIARYRRQPLSEVFGVATFYSQFHLSPRGQTIIRVCTGTACHVAGANEVLSVIAHELNVAVGATTDDLRFTLEAVACVGCCSLAPVAVVDGEPTGRLGAASARRIARDLLKAARR